MLASPAPLQYLGLEGELSDAANLPPCAELSDVDSDDVLHSLGLLPRRLRLPASTDSFSSRALFKLLMERCLRMGFASEVVVVLLGWLIVTAAAGAAAPGKGVGIGVVPAPPTRAAWPNRSGIGRLYETTSVLRDPVAYRYS